MKKKLLKLVESNKINNVNIKELEIDNAEKFQESVGGAKVNCLGAYTFPISRPDQENLNERVYSSSLWENVIKNKMGEKSFGLLDHPEDEGEFKNAACVWKNIRFNENKSLVLADAYLFGNNGKHVKEAINAGGDVGLSTVGFGDFEDDGKTIVAESYVLERMADFVLDPSYQVFGNSQNEMEVEEKKDNKEKSIKENVGDIDMNTKIQKLEERDFKHKINNAISDIEKITDVEKKLKEYVDLYTVWDEIDYCPELKENVKAKIEEFDEEYQKLVKKGKKFSDVVEKAVGKKIEIEEKSQKLSTIAKKTKKEKAELQKKYDTAVSLLGEMKEYSKKLKSLYLNLRKKTKKEMIDRNSYLESRKQIDLLQDELESMKEKYKKVNKKYNSYRNQYDSKIKEEFDYKKEMEKSKKALQAKKAKVLKQKKKEKTRKEAIDRKRGLNFNNIDEIKEWFEDIVESDPIATALEEEILSCKTLVEAQKTYMNFRDLLEEEGITKPTQRSRFDGSFRTKLRKDLAESVEAEDYDDYSGKRSSWV